MRATFSALSNLLAFIKGCESGTKTGVAGDCKKYLECENGAFVSKECEQNDPEIVFHFDSVSKKCVDSHDPHECQEADGACKEGDKTGVVNDCKIYTECLNSTLVNNTCNDNLNFDVVTKSCKVEGEAVCLCKGK